MEILGAIKTYDWGSVGGKSKVAQLALNVDDAFAKDFDGKSPYAELWMGDHVSGPSTVKETGEPLDKWLSKQEQSAIGGMDKLPFLFKVLSITKPLSIQIHPNKTQSEHLHATRPDIYKDPNHKPEISIALTDFSALCGFRTPLELHRLLTKFQPLVDLIGSANVEQLQRNPCDESIKLSYTQLMHSPQAAITDCITKLEKILNECDDAESKLLLKTFNHCNHYFPNDVGVLSIFFMNILQLKAGQAIFLAANQPHAYLSGDCIECMACSDNVIRAGLTPKFKDVETLLEMLSFNGTLAEETFFLPTEIAPYAQLFKPPVNDFAVVQISVPPHIEQYAIENRQYGSIIIVLKGTAEATADGKALAEVKEGTVIFVPSCIKNIGLNIGQANDDGFVAYQAMYNDF